MVESLVKPRRPETDDERDVVLMRRVRRDDADAFAELVRRHWTSVFARCYQHLGDRQEAEDLAQELFLRLYRRRSKFSTWLFHITQNLIRNALRRRRRRPCIQMSDLAQSSELRPERLVPDDGESPSQPLERTELAARVRAAMEGLGRRQRQALILHQFQHRTCADIADAMDMSPNAAKALLYRARLELRDALFPIVSG